MNTLRSPLERLSFAVASVALSLATLAALVIVPTRVAQDPTIAAAASPAYAVVDVRYVSYEPATRVN